MKKKFEKPEIEVIEFEASDIIATSGDMVDGTVMGSTSFTTQNGGMAGGTIGGNTTFTPQY